MHVAWSPRGMVVAAIVVVALVLPLRAAAQQQVSQQRQPDPFDTWMVYNLVDGKPEGGSFF